MGLFISVMWWPIISTDPIICSGCPPAKEQKESAKPPALYRDAGVNKAAGTVLGLLVAGLGMPWFLCGQRAAGISRL